MCCLSAVDSCVAPNITRHCACHQRHAACATVLGMRRQLQCSGGTVLPMTPWQVNKGIYPEVIVQWSIKPPRPASWQFQIYRSIVPEILNENELAQWPVGQDRLDSHPATQLESCVDQMLAPSPA